jgi:glutathione S-transferase
MVELYRTPFSTNVERVSLALAHKGIETTSIVVPNEDRRAIAELTGQELAPVLVDGDEVVFDSTRILFYLEDHYPDAPLLPADGAAAAAIRIFIDWFNRVWKLSPNQIFREAGHFNADERLIAARAAEMRERAGWFEALLDGRDYLFGEFSLADCAAYPFLKYITDRTSKDDEYYHQLLRWYQRFDSGFPRLEAWIARLGEHPRV